MAQIYYPKKTSAKLLEGAVAGLIGGVVATVVMVLSDFLTPERSWWSSASVVGSIFTGVQNFNTASPDMASLLLGLVLTLLIFALLGMGLPSYMPIFRRFNLHPALGGALYGLLIWLFVDVLFLNALTSGRLSMLWLLPANLLAGATMGWWLKRIA
ncbi:MAG TPA: hypothetical protein VJ183_07380 [Chloroflexia bacterium]|nr:hypothetical protein [Chloroflexia bacterium]